jgi:hypothetical protein
MLSRSAAAPSSPCIIVELSSDLAAGRDLQDRRFGCCFSRVFARLTLRQDALRRRQMIVAMLPLGGTSSRAAIAMTSHSRLRQRPSMSCGRLTPKVRRNPPSRRPVLYPSEGATQLSRAVGIVPAAMRENYTLRIPTHHANRGLRASPDDCGTLCACQKARCRPDHLHRQAAPATDNAALRNIRKITATAIAVAHAQNGRAESRYRDIENDRRAAYRRLVPHRTGHECQHQPFVSRRILSGWHSRTSEAQIDLAR